jgi:hypothetical protein
MLDLGKGCLPPAKLPRIVLFMPHFSIRQPARTPPASFKRVSTIPDNASELHSAGGSCRASCKLWWCVGSFGWYQPKTAEVDSTSEDGEREMFSKWNGRTQDEIIKAARPNKAKNSRFRAMLLDYFNHVRSKSIKPLSRPNFALCRRPKTQILASLFTT